MVRPLYCHPQLCQRALGGTVLTFHEWRESGVVALQARELHLLGPGLEALALPLPNPSQSQHLVKRQVSCVKAAPPTAPAASEDRRDTAHTCTKWRKRLPNHHSQPHQRPLEAQSQPALTGGRASTASQHARIPW